MQFTAVSASGAICKQKRVKVLCFGVKSLAERVGKCNKERGKQGSLYVGRPLFAVT